MFKSNNHFFSVFFLFSFIFLLINNIYVRYIMALQSLHYKYLMLHHDPSESVKIN